MNDTKSMHIAYSVLNNNTDNADAYLNIKDNDILLRYRAYQITCEKYSSEIAAVQKYIPGWMPKFR